MRLFTTLLIVLLSFETALYARSDSMGVAAHRKIEMKERIHGSEGKNSQRSSTFYPVHAFIDRSSLQIEFCELPCNVEVSIVNVQTYEVFHSETYVSTDNVMISLDGLKRGEYRLEVSLDTNKTILYGDFSF